ncbi:MAG TPA: hypothetical protein VFO76_03590 [Candidatus Kapabacteria bacterium]|nr:hypothetical protein [Candidatus Kapabacteria bacterium]
MKDLRLLVPRNDIKKGVILNVAERSEESLSELFDPKEILRLAQNDE